MSKVSKDFWVSKGSFYHIKNPDSDAVYHIQFNDKYCKETGTTEKITISYEIDREVTIKESDLRKVFDDLEFSERDFGLIKQRIFGGGENE